MSFVNKTNDIVHNKFFTNKNNIKTRMCNNILTKGECPFGDKCRFAHSQDEIRKAPCAFQKNCKNKNCPYSHDDSSELEKIVNEVEDKMKQLALIEKESKDLVIDIQDDDAEDAIQKINNKMQDELKYEEKYYEDVKIRIGEDEEEAYKYMEEYDRQIKTVNNYNINITLDEYTYKKLMFYLQSTGCDFNVEKK